MAVARLVLLFFLVQLSLKRLQCNPHATGGANSGSRCDFLQTQFDFINNICVVTSLAHVQLSTVVIYIYGMFEKYKSYKQIMSLGAFALIQMLPKSTALESFSLIL